MQSHGVSADIIIVGCGPTGATLSLLLAQCGITSLVLEREKSIYPLPRAVHFDDQIMRIFQGLNIADALARVVRYNPGMRFVDPQGELLLDWPRPEGIGENGWHTSYRFHQPDLENILRNKIQSTANIQLKSGVEVDAIEQSEQQASVRCTNGEEYRAKYVVGCDGANSIVRSTIGNDIQDFGFNERWLVIDALLKSDKPELGDYTIQHCGRDRPSTYVRCPGDRRRWEISLKPEDDTRTVTSDSSIWNFIGEWVNAEDASIERSAVYEFKSQVAKTWRRNRLFIAGDAAHLTPPFMGQGMCAGIRDAANLAWKLAICCRQQQLPDNTRAALLDSYQTERIPNVTEYIDTAIKLGALINSCGTEVALKRAFTRDDGTVQLKSMVPTLGPGVGLGSNACVGSWCIQPQLQNGTLLDDMARYKPILIIEPRLLREHQASANAETHCLVITTQAEPDLQSVLTHHGVDALLIRPDRYILGSANSAVELAELLNRASAMHLA